MPPRNTGNAPKAPETAETFKAGTNVTAEVTSDKLVITAVLSEVAYKTDNSYMFATTHGKWVVPDSGGLVVALNVYRPLPKDERRKPTATGR